MVIGQTPPSTINDHVAYGRPYNVRYVLGSMRTLRVQIYGDTSEVCYTEVYEA